jgi:hypothetical protein
MGKPYILKLISVLLLMLFLAGCEMIVEDFETRSCNPDPPTSCEDLGDENQQKTGCCTPDADAVWYCEDGVLETTACGELDCDFDPNLEAMACVN